ncbi:MAG: hypothetical protein ACUVQ8_08350 [Nitrososphaeria archaeon]
MSDQAQETRLNFVTKILGLILLIAGVFVEYMILTTNLYPALSWMFQILAIIMIVVGVLSLIAKLI